MFVHFYLSLIAHLLLPRCASESKGHGTPVDTKCRTSARSERPTIRGEQEAEQSSEEKVESKHVEQEKVNDRKKKSRR